MPAKESSEFLAKRYEMLTVSLIASVEAGEEDSVLNQLFEERNEMLNLIEQTELDESAKQIMRSAIGMDAQLLTSLQAQSASAMELLMANSQEKKAIGTYGRAMMGSGNEPQTRV